MGIILNKINLLMLIVFIIGVIFFLIGSIKNFDIICNHYGTTPNYDTLFTTYECKKYFKPLTCNKLVPDVSECHDFKPNYTKI